MGHLSSNVPLAFAFRISDSLASGIWSAAVLSTYVDLLMSAYGDASIEVRSAAKLAKLTEPM